MTEDWRAVARTINARMAQRRVTRQGLVTVSGVLFATLRLLQNGKIGRRAQNGTLVAVARTLGWPDDHFARVVSATSSAPCTTWAWMPRSLRRAAPRASPERPPGPLTPPRSPGAVTISRPSRRPGRVTSGPSQRAGRLSTYL
ncbi:MAG: hypothetical protein ACQSGP_26030 [Frankia sp.]